MHLGLILQKRDFKRDFGIVQTICFILYAVCFVGEYLSADGFCELCPIGSYNSIEGITVAICTLCPSGYTTTSVGSTSINQCFCKYTSRVSKISEFYFLSHVLKVPRSVPSSLNLSSVFGLFPWIIHK